MPNDKPSSNPRFQYSLRTLLLVTAGVAIVFSTYRTAGIAALYMALIFGTLLGIAFVVVLRRWLRWYCLAVFCGAMIGASLGVELAACDGSVNVNSLRNSGILDLNSGPDQENTFLALHAGLGTFLGGVAGAIVGWRLAVRSGLRQDAHALRWYRPSRGAIVVLSILAGYMILMTTLVAYGAHRYSIRSSAAKAIKGKGVKIQWEGHWMDLADGGAEEINARDSQLSDTELDDVITLVSPKGRVLLENSKITNEGVYKLQNALPNCSIEP